MKTVWTPIRRFLLRLPAEETGFERRGFRGATPAMRMRLESAGAAFMGGYHQALEHGLSTSLETALNATELDFRGFAFEGAAMGLAVLDAFTPWRANRISEFLRGPGDPHAYMVHVGVGWVWARLPRGFPREQRRLDPMLKWLALDGWGFHEGFFHWPKYMQGQPAPRRLKGYARRAFDQGLGRSWWFVNGGNPSLIATTIKAFPPERQADFWSGLGLAACYAGVATPDDLAALRDYAGDYWPQLAQGAVFAAKARQRAGNMTEYTDLAARVLCGLPAGEAARLADATLENLSANCGLFSVTHRETGIGNEPVYEIWRQRVQNHFQFLQYRATPKGQYEINQTYLVSGRDAPGGVEHRGGMLLHGAISESAAPGPGGAGRTVQVREAAAG